MRGPSLDPQQLVERATSGDRRAVGRLLTLVERGGDAAEEIAELTGPLARRAHVIGITGPPGAGKSTLVGRLVAALVAGGSVPGVVAVDPSSPLTGGAILGDRVRMTDVDHVAFIRSVATRGHAGGLALAVPGAVRVLDACGFSPVVVETVGVGQVEVDVTAAADTTVVVVTPGMGDAVQANKAGLLEVGDVFVVNKADLPGAADVRRDLDLMLDLSHVSGAERGRRPPIVMTDSRGGEGIDAVLAAVAQHVAHLDTSGEREARRRRRAEHEILSRVTHRLDRRLAGLLSAPAQQALVADVAAGRISTTAAADAITHLLTAPPANPTLGP